MSLWLQKQKTAKKRHVQCLLGTFYDSSPMFDQDKLVMLSQFD